jgi:(R,R)-butanediol dehydrogenase/meso-butanediol dehydrogenase/diacetyl reductase
MQAAVYYGKLDLRIEDVPEPDPARGEVKIQVSRNGICGTDLHEYYGGPMFVSTEPQPRTGKSLPVILGHEFAGVVTAVGRGVTSVAEGDRVTVEPTYWCGVCRPCRTGSYHLCDVIGFHGLTADGAMAEFTVVPENQVHKLPEGVTVEMGALAEPMAVAYHAAAMAELGAQDSAIIYGGGPIGIGLWFALRGMGLTEIDVVEPSETRRACISALGARTWDPMVTNVPELIADRTRGVGVDAAFDAAGVAPAVESALACLAERRPLISIAIYDRPILTPLIALVMRERRVQGSMGYTATDYDAVLRLMAENHYDPTGWVETVALSRVVDDGFEPLHSGEKMKLLVDPTR